jgi:hypothetical protein
MILIFTLYLSSPTPDYFDFEEVYYFGVDGEFVCCGIKAVFQPTNTIKAYSSTYYEDEWEEIFKRSETFYQTRWKEYFPQRQFPKLHFDSIINRIKNKKHKLKIRIIWGSLIWKAKEPTKILCYVGQWLSSVSL